MNPIRNILFDLGGVLIDIHRMRGLRRLTALGLHGMVGLAGEFERGVIDEAQFRDRVREAAGRDLGDRQIDTAWNEIIGAVPPGHIAMLDELKERGFRLFLLSNTNAIHYRECERTFRAVSGGVPMSGFFEHIFLSYELGMTKPDPAIFRHVARRAAIDPGVSLFIDDDVRNTIAAAKEGFRVHRHDPAQGALTVANVLGVTE
ncbi:HAD family hydrolase [Kiritimatiella glycovorans]|uniref:Alpha-D-glucose-1-phosphate phosphatase YihX n=1 Tax=Kiritimatiella glycovorans TaxID=1307763 RepID=A0A0G3EGA4_9BACT|nr:HAD family phosphatase [Kiritimatiella glycovorans]AKJ65496.1 Alpha-D-glucose-1-phosphate phosphatase YihX [Kiritimatiella glycovorans]